jgi:hypothetical protein
LAQNIRLGTPPAPPRTRDPAYWQPTASILYDTPVGPAYDGAGLMITPLVMARADEVIE